MSKSFNHWVANLREKPFLTLAESLLSKLISRLHKKYNESLGCRGGITPATMKRLNLPKRCTNRFGLIHADLGEYQISDNGKERPEVSRHLRASRIRRKTPDPSTIEPSATGSSTHLGATPRNSDSRQPPTATTTTRKRNMVKTEGPSSNQHQPPTASTEEALARINKKKLRIRTKMEEMGSGRSHQV
ncbi:hypothetical protein RJT34_15032 [Clitoria ternatea]|uniref:Uncharacterized protein n=1 Tax=Clitoria ternatea TaxID=43366 RepID=A0AAN9JTQ8_CLITE